MEPLALHGYTTAAGDRESREAVAADLRRRTNDDIQADNIFFTCGAAPAIISVVLAAIAMLVYIWIRFRDLRFASASVLALVHDVLVDTVY